MIPVVLESPYSGDVTRNLYYARRAMRDCLLRGEAPYASHLLYTQPGVLDDTVLEEREMGMSAGWEWIECADYSVVYIDYGISRGMQRGIAVAQQLGKEVYYRRIGAGH